MDLKRSKFIRYDVLTESWLGAFRKVTSRSGKKCYLDDVIAPVRGQPRRRVHKA